MKALDVLRLHRQNLEVIWFETPPQHWPPFGAYDTHLSYGQGGDDVRCMREISAPAQGTRQSARPTFANMPTQTGVPGGYGANEFSQRSAILLAQRLQNITVNFQNTAARPILEAHNVPVVPLWQALRSRGHLHKIVSGNRLDCTHWCEHSEATLHLAGAALNIIAAIGSKTGSRAHTSHTKLYSHFRQSMPRLNKTEVPGASTAARIV